MTPELQSDAFVFLQHARSKARDTALADGREDDIIDIINFLER
jgi:hypothetical protein